MPNAEILKYCIASDAPTLTYANNPTPVVTVYDFTNFTCDFGYETTGSSSPFCTCDQMNSTVGKWSNVTFLCVRMNKNIIIFIIFSFI